MLVSAAEPILYVTSNSLFAFLFCNFIVLVIFIGAKLGSNDSRTRDAMPVFDLHYDVKQPEIDDVERFSSDQIVRSSRSEMQVQEKLALWNVTDSEIKIEEEILVNIVECKNENESNNHNEEDDGEEVNDDDDDNGEDELRRRIEDFIAKVNREWEAENLKERMHQTTTLLTDAQINQEDIDIPRTEQNSNFVASACIIVALDKP